jgi:hypothetical protein
MPVFTTEEVKNHGNQDELSDIPRAVIHLINKRPVNNGDHMTIEELKFSAPWTRVDFLKLESFSKTVGRCHENV